MPKNDDGSMKTTIEDDEIFVICVSDMPGMQLAIGRPGAEKRPAIMMWSTKRQGWHLLGRFNGDIAALAAVEFLYQMSEQINRTQEALENQHNKTLPHQDTETQDNG